MKPNPAPRLRVSAVNPQRVQLRRTAGWKMPPNTVKVCRPGKWGNPFLVSAWGQAEAVTLYKWAIELSNDERWQKLRKELPELRGKNLACWCKPGQPCHADVLLELANKQSPIRNRKSQIP